MESRIYKDYVFTPCRNAFNEKTSWWISKKGCTVAHYCFSAMTEKEVDEQLGAGGADGYVALYESKTNPGKYIVVDEHLSGAGDTWTEVYDTPEEANSHAKAQWEHLTEKERMKRHVYAARVLWRDLANYAVDENGVVDWRCWGSCRDFPGAFDSSKAKGEEKL